MSNFFTSVVLLFLKYTQANFTTNKYQSAQQKLKLNYNVVKICYINTLLKQLIAGKVVKIDIRLLMISIR